jgi:hypothetical protein
MTTHTFTAEVEIGGSTIQCDVEIDETDLKDWYSSNCDSDDILELVDNYLTAEEIVLRELEAVDPGNSLTALASLLGLSEEDVIHLVNEHLDLEL